MGECVLPFDDLGQADLVNPDVMSGDGLHPRMKWVHTGFVSVGIGEKEMAHGWFPISAYGSILLICHHLHGIASGGEKDDAVQFAYGSHEMSVEAVVLLGEQLSLLEEALRSLSPQARDIFLRNLINGEKPEQLARRYPTLKPHTISQIVFRAKQRVRAAWSVSWRSCG